MIRIGSDTDIGVNRNSSDWLGMNSYPILSPRKTHKHVETGTSCLHELATFFKYHMPFKIFIGFFLPHYTLCVYKQIYEYKKCFIPPEYVQ